MEKNEITIDEHRFRLRVVESLAKLEGLAQSTDGHLARLNGSVARHEEKINSLQAAMLTERAASRATSTWWQRISPLLWLAAGGVLALFLLHSEQLLRLFSKP
jgi:hypothetical protein